MSAPRDLYLLDKEEVTKAMAIVTSPVFERLLVFAIADFAAQNPTQEQIAGANRFISLLKGFPDDHGKFQDIPGSGLQHDERAPLDYALVPTHQSKQD